MIIIKHIKCPVCKGKKIVKKTEADLVKVMRYACMYKPCENCNGRGVVCKEVQI